MKKICSVVLSLGLLLCATAGARDAALVKQQYDTVKSKLDDGGDLMIVANVDGLLESGVQKMVALVSLAPAGDPSAESMRAAMAKLPAFLKANGFYAITGLGFSSVPTDDNLNTIKGFISRDPAAAALPLWRGLFGLQALEMKTAAFLPSDTEFVRTFAGEPGQLWKIARQAVTELGTPENAVAFEQSLAMSAMMLGAPLDTLIGSIGNEGFISVQLSPANTVALPLGENGETVAIPEPSMLIGIAVKDSTLANLFKTRFCGEGMPATLSEKDGVEIITMNAPVPSPVPVQITMASQSNLLLIGSSTGVIDRALAAAKSGNGLFATDKFKTAFGSLPLKNNGLIYLSPECAKIMAQVQAAAIAKDTGPDAAMNSAMMKLFQSEEPQQAAMVILNTKSGILLAGKTTVSGRYMLASAAAAPMGMMAAIAIPSFVKARTSSQSNACINNLRLIDAAKEQWAIEKGAEAGAPVSPSDIEPYLRSFPSCPAGGSYILNAVGEAPTCDKPGHTLMR